MSARDEPRRVWGEMAKLAFRIVALPDNSKSRIECQICGFRVDLGEKSLALAEITRMADLRVSMGIQHMRVAHREIYLEMLERVYMRLVRNHPIWPKYVDATDSGVVDLVAPTSISPEGDRRLVCNLCGFDLPFLGHKETDEDAKVREQMHAHVYVCHRKQMWEAREIVRESWEVRDR